MVRRLVLCMLLGLGACATPADRITGKLVELGVPQHQARCMGTRLGERLTTAQLRKLGRVANVDGHAIGGMSLREIVRRLSSVDDPELVAELLRAGVGCAI